MNINNRETWLNTVTDRFIRDHFKKVGYTIPDNVRMGCSFTSRGAFKRIGQKSTRIGECWSASASEGGHSEIMISPTIADSTDAIAILIHELVHATVGNHEGHNQVFKRCAIAVGLEGKMTATVASEPLKATIAQWLQSVGEYPHATLNANLRKQSTRLHKCECVRCGYTMRISSKWLKLATPRCPLGCGQMSHDFEGDDYEE
jgi:hypothetical protein